MEKQVLFKVIDGVSGHEYVVYANGDTEGFPSRATIINYYPILRSQTWARGGREAEQRPKPPRLFRGCK